MAVVLKTPEQEREERKNRGLEICLKNLVIEVEKGLYIVRSQNKELQTYTVEGQECDCPDFKRRKLFCKHIYSVIYYNRFNQIG